MHDIEPWAYLRDLLTLLPSWPRNAVLGLAPKWASARLTLGNVASRARRMKHSSNMRGSTVTF